MNSVELVLFVGSLACYSFIGTIGNILILIVYTRRSEQMAMSVSIKLLAWIDLLVCVCIIPYTVVFEMQLVLNAIACHLFEVVRHFTLIVSNMILTVLAVERYFAVCRPLRKLAEEQVCMGIRVVVVLSVLFAVPSTGMLTVSAEYAPLETSASGNKTTNSTLKYELPGTEQFCHFTTQYLTEMGTLLYQGFLVLLFFVGVFILAVLYALVYSAVWKRSRKWRVNRVGPSRRTVGTAQVFVLMSEYSPNSSSKTNTRTEPQRERLHPNLLDISSSKRTSLHSSRTLNVSSSSANIDVSMLTEPHSISTNSCSMEDTRPQLKHNFEIRNMIHPRPVNRIIHPMEDLIIPVDIPSASSEMQCHFDVRDHSKNALTTPEEGGVTRIDKTPKRFGRRLPIGMPSMYSESKCHYNAMAHSENISTKTEEVDVTDKTPKREEHRRSAMPSPHKTATMLFACTLIYAVTWIPFWLDVFNVTQSVPLRYQFFISNFTNPIVYGMVNPQVRSEIVSTIKEARERIRNSCCRWSTE